MRIAMVLIDTRGGVQPYVALAMGLQRAGHDVRIATPGEFVPMVTERDLTAVPLSGGIENAIRELVEHPPRRLRDRVRAQVAVFGDHLGQWSLETLDGVRGVDLVVAGSGALVARPVAEKLGVPFLTAHIHPVEAPTGEYPGVLASGVPGWLGRPGRWASHWLSDTGMRLPHRAAVRRARVEVLGLPPRPDHPARTPGPARADGAGAGAGAGGRAVGTSAGAAASTSCGVELPVLYGYSRHVVPRPASWAPHRHVTGYWWLPARADWTPPPALEEFLAAGPPPVCIGFGSMPSPDPRALTRLVLAAVRRAGVRAVLLSAWGGLAAAGAPAAADGTLAAAAADHDRTDPPPDVLTLDEVPYDWLFPRVAAAVHHGGAGTTGASLAAGLPTVVVPWGMDQYFWARRVEALGVGPRHVRRSRLTVDALAEALHVATTDAAMRRRAAGLGRDIRAEDGVGEATRILTALAHTLDHGDRTGGGADSDTDARPHESS